MDHRCKKLFKLLAVVMVLVAASAGAGCSTLPPRIPGYPEGDVAARRRTKKLAVVSFLANYDFGPSMNLSTVFAPGTRYQKTVESMYMYFADELLKSPYFRILPAAGVKRNRFYKSMKVNPDPRSRVRSTCPSGFRKLCPDDEFDYGRLCRELKVDGLVIMEFTYSTYSNVFTRGAKIHAANLFALGADGTILYSRRGFTQFSGAQYFAEYAWLRRRSFAQDIYNLEIAVRAIAGDLIRAFAPR